MYVRQHLQEGLTVNLDPPLVAHVCLAGRPARVVPTGEVSPVAPLAVGNGRPGDGVSLAVAVQAPPDVAGIAVFLPETAVHLGVAALHKITFPAAGGHGVVEDPRMPLVAGGAAHGAVCGSSRVPY